MPIASVKQNVGPASMDTKSTLTETNANQLKIQQIVLSTKIVRFAILKKDAWYARQDSINFPIVKVIAKNDILLIFKDAQYMNKDNSTNKIENVLYVSLAMPWFQDNVLLFLAQR